MNYGYEPTRNDELLADKLEQMLEAKWLQYPEIKIEINRMYPGVRLRKITRLSQVELDMFIKDCDAIYDAVSA